eukprot:m.8977 g.8977  ORF g.8977 m.8977 type:complete len:63 (-) comp3323_c0_seq1:241-429(-)
MQCKLAVSQERPQINPYFQPSSVTRENTFVWQIQLSLPFRMYDVSTIHDNLIELLHYSFVLL